MLYEKRCRNLLVAAEGGFEDVVGALLAAGADAGARDRAGRTALAAASVGSNTDGRSDTSQPLAPTAYTMLGWCTLRSRPQLLCARTRSAMN